MSCAVMYQPYSASPYQPQAPEAAFVRGASPADTTAAAAAAAVGAHGKEQYKVCGSPSAPVLAGHQTPPGQSEEDAPPGSQHNVKFLTSNCVLVTNYCGDAAHVVDEHFARALSHGAGFETKHGMASGKDNLPMTQRNLPASFWNSGYHSRSTATSIGHGGGHDLYSDPYHSSALHGLHQSADPWHYALATQAAGYPARDLAGYGSSTAGVAAAAAARFNGYGPLLFPSGSRLPTAGQSTKSEWGAARGYSDVPPELGAHPHPHPHAHPHAHPLDPGFGAGAVGYGNGLTGLESSLHAAAGGKDSYWL
ncbi:transcription cofactor vestigial-like protein 2 isoform X2 [Amphibalanus amphitrite]|uniref:transcription cofactor vestigial-like protein 2 isoform X2 n=1 Tax=Amphibalanus amphitrite TaxID=1232801 RepID=UPI001C90B9A3|nr:transcription cofactor vestigial-like protein 2 isoform X2 [Amphibalanus amphitrite]